MQLKAFYHEDTFTLTYVVWDAETKAAAIVDPVLDYDPAASQTRTTALEEVAAFIDAEGLKPAWILETHAHADHLSGSQYLRRRYDAKVVIGAKITAVQETFKPVFGFGDDFATDGSQFDRLISEGDELPLGNLKVEVIETPGHTPACVTFKIDDAIFTGDALFIEDYGTGRCDFPKGSANDLFDSVRKLYELPDSTRVFVGHDYQPDGRELRYETTIAASKERNKQLSAKTSREEFVAFRQERDSALAAPRLLLQSVQVNVDAGHLPSANGSGRRYLNMPINLFRPTDEVGEVLKPS